MKHVFIINPMSGSKDRTERVSKEINDLKVDSEIYITKDKLDATRFVKEYCQKHPLQETRFYACGGDGTINEVASGLVHQDKKYFSMTCYAIGSGNDYIKIFGGKKNFSDLGRLIEAKNKEVDLMEINNGLAYSINVVNYGLDSYVLKAMEKIKRNKNTTNEKAYKKATLQCIFTKRRNEGQTHVDGELMLPGKFIFCTISNGQYVGGLFKCSPISICDDGKMDVIIIKPVTIFKVPFMIGKYSKGTFLNDRFFKKITKFRRTDGKVVIDGPEGFCITCDGEIQEGTHFEVTNIKHAINFAVPNFN